MPVSKKPQRLRTFKFLWSPRSPEYDGQEGLIEIEADDDREARDTLEALLGDSRSTWYKQLEGSYIEVNDRRLEDHEHELVVEALLAGLKKLEDEGTPACSLRNILHRLGVATRSEDTVWTRTRARNWIDEHGRCDDG